MKYLLVLQPTDINASGASRMPLGLPYINGAMRDAGFDVETVNLQYVGDKPMDVLQQIILSKNIDVVLCGGITIEYGLIKSVFEAARKAKPNIITVGGGGGFSSEPILFSEMTRVDYAIIGEGEITVCELARALNHGLDTDNIQGLVVRKGKDYIYTGPRPQIKDIDTIPFPSYEGLDMDKYLEEQTLDGWYHTFAAFTDDPRIMPMLMSRSCPFMCTFCYHPIGRGYRSRSMDSFFEELDGYIEQYHINAIALVDECFSINPKRVLEFCERIKPYHIFWSCQMRVETYSEELVRKMVSSGCVSACFGLENISQTILDDMNKKATSAQMKMALDVAYRNGGGVAANILFGAETETEDTVRETVEWLKDNPKYTINDFVMIGAYPGSGYYEHALKRGIIKDKRQFIEQGCPTINLTNFSEKKFQALVRYSLLKRLEVQNKGEVVTVSNSSRPYKVNVILRCSHCGYENDYRGISSAAYEKGIVQKMMCRKCHNYSDYIFDPKKVMEKCKTTEWIYDWLVGNANASLKRWVSANCITSIAIYGVFCTDFIVDEFRKYGVDVKYGIDIDSCHYQDKDFPVYGPDEIHPNGIFEQVDKIIVLAVRHYLEIEKTMRKRMPVEMVSFEEIVSS